VYFISRDEEDLGRLLKKDRHAKVRFVVKREQNESQERTKQCDLRTAGDSIPQEGIARRKGRGISRSQSQEKNGTKQHHHRGHLQEK